VSQQNISILFVGDEIEAQKEMLGLFQELSFYSIYKANGVKEGLDQFYINKPDIVLIASVIVITPS